MPKYTVERSFIVTVREEIEAPSAEDALEKARYFELDGQASGWGRPWSAHVDGEAISEWVQRGEALVIADHSFPQWGKGFEWSAKKQGGLVEDGECDE